MKPTTPLTFTATVRAVRRYRRHGDRLMIGGKIQSTHLLKALGERVKVTIEVLPPYSDNLKKRYGGDSVTTKTW